MTCILLTQTKLFNPYSNIWVYFISLILSYGRWCAYYFEIYKRQLLHKKPPKSSFCGTVLFQTMLGLNGLLVGIIFYIIFQKDKRHFFRWTFAPLWKKYYELNPQ